MLQKNDILFGYKAIALVPGLSGTDRQIAAAILDHYSRKTGRCHPSNDRLAKLCEVNERTVRKATEVLCQGPDALFEKVAYAGRAGCTEYIPNWSRFHDFVSEWSRKMSGQSRSGRVEECGPIGPDKDDKCGPFDPEMRPICSGNAAQTGRQTSIYNQSPEPIRTVGASGNVRADERKHASEARPISQIGDRDRLSKQQEPRVIYPQGKVAERASHGDAAMDAALRRINAALMALGVAAYSDALERMTESDQAEAAAAEMRRRGDGLHVLFKRLGALGGRRDNAIH